MISEQNSESQEELLAIGLAWLGLGTLPTQTAAIDGMIVDGEVGRNITSVAHRLLLSAGYKTPSTFFFESAQIFIKDGSLDEIRFEFLNAHEQPTPESTRLPWTTEVPPRFTLQGDRIILDEADTGRAHITLKGLKSEEGQNPFRTRVAANLYSAQSAEGSAAGRRTTNQRTAKRSVDRESLKNARRFTFIEARTMATAINDGTDLRNWKEVEGTLAMLHATTDRHGKVAPLQTRFEPSPALLGWWGRTDDNAEFIQLETELRLLDFESLLQFLTVLGAVLESELLRVTVTIDDIIEAIGRGTDARRSREIRAHWREKVWRALLTFDSMAVFGMRNGVWREPPNGTGKRARVETEQLHSKDALLRIIGQRGTANSQMSFDNSSVPKEVTITAGPWLEQFRGNRELLADFGHIRTIAAIPRGKPSGAWAACAGLMLQQRWREGAANASVDRVGGDKHTSMEFRPFTRRELLLDSWRSAHDVIKILNSDKPHRAKVYWREAVKLLKEANVIGSYRELKPPPSKLYNWQDSWLDQPLDIRPSTDLLQNALTIRSSAQEARKTRKGRQSAAKPK